VTNPTPGATREVQMLERRLAELGDPRQPPPDSPGRYRPFDSADGGMFWFILNRFDGS